MQAFVRTLAFTCVRREVTAAFWLKSDLNYVLEGPQCLLREQIGGVGGCKTRNRQTS